MSAAGRRFLAPEVVQTSSMDCGPAALASLLAGHGVAASYGRLREACQTDVDGTSIDTLEGVAQQLGLVATQVLVPSDHLLADAPAMLPALAVVRHVDAAPHFVVVWRRLGPWLQVMDPAVGRRWLRAEGFTTQLWRHAMSVDAADWRAWAASDDFLRPLRARLWALGVDAVAARALVDAALGDAGWFGLGTLDAAVRLVQALRRADGLGRGDAAAMARALVTRTLARPDDIFALLPAAYWSVTPDAGHADPGRERLVLRGAVLLKVAGLTADRHTAGTVATAAAPDGTDGPDPAPLSPELQAALHERPVGAMATVWRLLRDDGWHAPLLLGGVALVAAAAVVLEALLLRGMFDIAAVLATPGQRLAAGLALLAVMGLVPLLELPMLAETLRQGRRLDTRLRMALARTLPRLADRYFQSRPVSDMADRAHGIQAARSVPSLLLQSVQALAELALTLAGVALIAPSSAGPAALLCALAVALPLAVQPLLTERDLRVRNHAGALNGFYLDALLGLAPVRAHQAQRNVRRQHEGLLVEWAAALRGAVLLALAAEGAQALLGSGLAGGLLVVHFLQQQGVAGGDLLLVFWVLKLPAIGARLAALAQAWPAQRNALLRLMEPLTAPQELPPAAPTTASVAAHDEPPTTRHPEAAAIAIDGGRVLAGGHEILRDLHLAIAPGEQVAVVGASGSGKSSLLGLLLGWHRLADGRLQVDGQALDTTRLEALRRETAWVDPAVQVWNRSLLDNLGYAADDEALTRVGAVLQSARLRAVLQTLPQGLQSLLGEGGALLSGGEGQRVRLGRALLASGTRLVLLDEPFRGLDRAQRHALLAEARRWWSGRTLLCVTHDVGETRGFDRVLVVDGGRIVEDGPPAHLAARTGSRYATLLEAEARLHDSLWRGTRWRRWRLDRGRLQETAAGRAGPPPRDDVAVACARRAAPSAKTAGHSPKVPR